MNVVIVVDSIDNLTNGSVMTARRFADGLKKRGHSVIIVAIGADGENDCAVREKYVPLVTEISRLNQMKFAKFEKEKIAKAFEGADIVHLIFPFKFEKKCKFLADEMGIPATTAFHLQPENVSYNVGLGKCKLLNRFIYFFFKRKYYRHFDRVHCPSSFIANQLVKHGYKNELYVISNGYDPDFVPLEAKKVNKKFEIIMTGRLAPEKNQKVLIKAISLSAHKDDIHLTLLGNGPCKNKLVRLAKKLNVDADFDFLPKERLIPKLQNSDLYVHSATVEIEAIACLEAIACGLTPVIANSELSATKQFALDERSLFKDNDAFDLAKKIDYWYENRQECEIMSGRYAALAKKFSLENSLALTEKMFLDQIKQAERLT